jgi:hypothetical protein
MIEVEHHHFMPRARLRHLVTASSRKPRGAASQALPQCAACATLRPHPLQVAQHKFQTEN